MKIKEQKILLLRWLYDKKSNSKMINIADFYREKNIDISRNDAIGIIQSLQNQKLVRGTVTKDGIHALLTVEGAEYIEDLDESQNKEISPEEKVIFLDRLDDLTNKLSKMELGQQLIYDDIIAEIEEMKDLINILNKKSWFQLLKGKFVDLGLGELTKSGFTLLSESFSDQNHLNP